MVKHFTNGRLFSHANLKKTYCANIALLEVTSLWQHALVNVSIHDYLRSTLTFQSHNLEKKLHSCFAHETHNHFLRLRRNVEPFPIEVILIVAFDTQRVSSKSSCSDIMPALQMDSMLSMISLGRPYACTFLGWLQEVNLNSHRFLPREHRSSCSYLTSSCHSWSWPGIIQIQERKS